MRAKIVLENGHKIFMNGDDFVTIIHALETDTQNFEKAQSLADQFIEQLKKNKYTVKNGRIANKWEAR